MGEDMTTDRLTAVRPGEESAGPRIALDLIGLESMP